MMWQFYELTFPVARKDYKCQALENLGNLRVDEFDFKDRKTLVKIRNEKGKILKGTKYKKCKGMFDGEFCTFRARLDADDLCNEYELYEEW